MGGLLALSLSLSLVSPPFSCVRASAISEWCPYRDTHKKPPSPGVGRVRQVFSPPLSPFPLLFLFTQLEDSAEAVEHVHEAVLCLCCASWVGCGTPSVKRGGWGVQEEGDATTTTTTPSTFFLSCPSPFLDFYLKTLVNVKNWT